jgi:signal transduction histidine kinase
VINLETWKFDKNYAMIAFKDNAGGIEESVLDKIFEPYFTTKHATQGTGLGLYMCRMIIQKNMGGVLEAKNCANGVCFYIKVPVCVGEEMYYE